MNNKHCVIIDILLKYVKQIFRKGIVLIPKPTYQHQTRRRQSDDYLRRHTWCERCNYRRSAHVHHIKPVGMGGAPPDSPLHSDGNKIALCRECHKWAHQNPLTAKEKLTALKNISPGVVNVQA